MQNLEVGKVKKNTRKTMEEIKDLEDSVLKGKKYENKELEEKARKIEKSEDAISVNREFEDIMKSKNKKII